MMAYPLKQINQVDTKQTHKKRRITILGVILAAAAGLLFAYAVTKLLGVTAEKAAFILYVLWIFFGGALGCWFDEVGL